MESTETCRSCGTSNLADLGTEEFCAVCKPMPAYLKRIALLDGETLYEMWAEAIPYPPKGWEKLHALEQAPWTALAMKLIDIDAAPSMNAFKAARDFEINSGNEQLDRQQAEGER